MNKSIKIIGGIFLSLFILLIAGMVALVLLINPNDYKSQLQALAAKQNVQLTIDGDLSWSFYPHIGIHSGKFSIKPPAKGITKPLQFDSLDIAVKLLPLLQRQIIVDHIIIRGNEISMHDEASGNDTTIRNLLIESHDMNLDKRAFPLSLSLQASTTKPQRNVAFKSHTQVSVDQEIKHIDLNSLSIQIDNTDMSGDIHATLGDMPFLKVNLAGGAMDVDHYFPSDAKKTASGDQHSSGNKNDELIPVSSLHALPGEYHLSFKDFTVQRLHSTDLSIDITISPDAILTIKNLACNAYGGKLSIQGTMDARPSLPIVSLHTRLDNVNMEPALKDYLQIEKTFASGDFSFNMAVTTKGLTMAQLMQAMGGEFSFASRTITLNKVDLTSSLDASLLQLLQVKMPKLMSDDNKTVMSDLAGKGIIQQGVINNTSLTALGPCMQMNGAGTYNLSSSDVNYHLGIIFPSSNKDNTCSDINTKIKDIVWPIVCRGSLDEGAARICGADTTAMQKTVAKSAQKEVGKKLEKKLDETLQKKYGKDAEAIKNKLKGLF